MYQSLDKRNIDLRDHVDLVCALWLEESEMCIMAGVSWEPLAGM